MAGLRTLAFNAAIDRLREIDPNNPELTHVAPPNRVPTQDAIDRINDAITAALAAKQAGIPTGRPSWQRSEHDVGIELGPSYPRQKSYKDGGLVPSGTPGSVRPALVSPDGRSASFEVKTYDLNTNVSGLVRSISSQALTRRANPPPGMQQNVIIDVRGQNTSPRQRSEVIKQIVRGSQGSISPDNLEFKR